MHRPFAFAALAVLPSCPVVAQDRDNARLSDGDASHWSFELGGGTDNRSKGASKSGNAPYVFGEAQWNAASGFYADVEFETIDSSGSDVEAEAEAEAGWQDAALGFDFDISTSHKWRVGAEESHDDAAWEFQFDIMREFGPVDTRLRIEHSPDGLGSTRDWTWIEGRLRWPLADRVTAGVTLGQREQDHSPDYVGWNAGVTWSVAPHLDLDLRWHGTNEPSPSEIYDDELVAGFVVTF